MKTTLSSPLSVPVGVTTARAPRLRYWRAALLLTPMFAMLLLFCLAPMGWVVIHSLQSDDGLTLGHFKEILGSPFYLQAFDNSLRISLYSSVIGLLVTLAGAASLRRVESRLKNAVVAFINMTSNLSGVPLAFAFIIIVGTNGALTLLFRQWGWLDDFHLYSRSGLILLYTYFQLPLGLLLLYPALDALDDHWQEAASLLGANHWAYWRHVGLPVLAPALLGTFILLFANAMGAYATAFALTAGNFNLVTVRIASLVSGNVYLEPNMAAALSVLLVALLALVTAMNQWLLKRSYHAR
ncbi:ABC transporter permease [Pseudogulbenkiania subflava]|uniref:Putative spermidine/putrescine transport system permease protein n=1 Tax=Pseudogulbenkiania subflava DSM 22618 TaxID=1123014 RepID=A0A1Y6C1C2_9NEIS|nr:ABC transporter permease subunit [Pseudogulbenkiania subflava]SMF38615.1 putative spermidine/putrescine transport system permease protein [Pseudogulbenkiania subflava DSM 22618]